MFLLIRSFRSLTMLRSLIYIPLCFYLYGNNGWGGNVGAKFTFHYVSTYTNHCCHIRRTCNIFTFHYVSTYTAGKARYVGQRINLHSTMFLLIRYQNNPAVGYQMHLHSTMFLLIPDSRTIEVPEQYLHSTMFLLIPVG